MNHINHVRPAAVAGLFYPADASQLHGWLKQALGTTNTTAENDDKNLIPRALIAPHAGYIYSGGTAAKAFRLWAQANDQIKTVVVMGPAHRVGFYGMSTVDFDELETPLGNLKLATDLRDRLMSAFPYLRFHNAANEPEHSLEVMFPFIKELLPDAKVLPLLNGSISAEEVKDVLASLWQEDGVYFVISSDLSHFHPYAEAQAIDAETADMIESGQWQTLDGEHACGYKGIQGLLAMSEDMSLRVESIERVNSGDTAGSKNSVVGYGSWAIYQETEQKQ
ncbi:AmmeMemoRadiSam system protein B [Thiomicrorhabdus sp.]|uniref:AmmeMemoRadiSam system protein B n=1 Tax=Thiomicrorhabdus sp. TaxID=2039724 RepID=UPI0029C852BA|nr:AmmeMemoRadiSam system protein B [Thiomicrorhabdus sp.]